MFSFRYSFRRSGFITATGLLLFSLVLIGGSCSGGGDGFEESQNQEQGAKESQISKQEAESIIKSTVSELGLGDVSISTYNYKQVEGFEMTGVIDFDSETYYEITVGDLLNFTEEHMAITFGIEEITRSKMTEQYCASENVNMQETHTDSAGVEHTLTAESSITEIGGVKVCYSTIKQDGYKIGTMSQTFFDGDYEAYAQSIGRGLKDSQVIMEVLLKYYLEAF